MFRSKLQCLHSRGGRYKLSFILHNKEQEIFAIHEWAKEMGTHMHWGPSRRLSQNRHWKGKVGPRVRSHWNSYTVLLTDICLFSASVKVKMNFILWGFHTCIQWNPPLKHFLFSCCITWLKLGHIGRETNFSIEKIPPPDWSVGEPMVHFLDWFEWAQPTVCTVPPWHLSWTEIRLSKPWEQAGKLPSSTSLHQFLPPGNSLELLLWCPSAVEYDLSFRSSSACLESWCFTAAI